jgi:hypothetical protein
MSRRKRPREGINLVGVDYALATQGKYPLPRPSPFSASKHPLLLEAKF